jgi:SNF2 family DNA or RNA helicase
MLAALISLLRKRGIMTGTAQTETDISYALAIVLEHVARGEQIAVFSEKIQTLDVLAAAFTAAGISFVNFRGAMSREDRAESVEAFNAQDSSVSVFLASAAANEGITLKCAALLNMERPDPLRPEVRAQRLARIDRVGNTREVTVFDVAVHETAEESIARFITAKQELLDSVTV